MRIKNLCRSSLLILLALTLVALASCSPRYEYDTWFSTSRCEEFEISGYTFPFELSSCRVTDRTMYISATKQEYDALFSGFFAFLQDNFARVYGRGRPGGGMLNFHRYYTKDVSTFEDCKTDDTDGGMYVFVFTNDDPRPNTSGELIFETAHCIHISQYSASNTLQGGDKNINYNFTIYLAGINERYFYEQ